jgi:hypothetical protein
MIYTRIECAGVVMRVQYEGIPQFVGILSETMLECARRVITPGNSFEELAIPCHSMERMTGGGGRSAYFLKRASRADLARSISL